MSNNRSPLVVLDISKLTDAQVIEWYGKHYHPTVRALVERLAFNNDKHKGERISAYQDGFQAGAQGARDGIGLTPEELRLGAIYARASDWAVRRKPAWQAARLPEYGESSYCLVLKGTDRTFKKRYPKRPIRTALRATRPYAPCLRRYFLAIGSPKAETISWGIPPATPIRPFPNIVYTVEDFASFADAAEALCYASVLKAYLGRNPKVFAINHDWG
jgi:hypothetical protein